LAVILWGAYVRASGSGAGCGSHWPLCNGQVIPRAAPIQTLVEFAHRMTSGLALVLVVGLIIWAFRAYPRRHPARLGAALSLCFIISEALVGAGLVLLGLVADNDSATRASALAVHLLNTFLLLAALTLTAWWASGGRPLQLRERGAVVWLLGLALLGTLFLGMSGAVTALGDTLFPAGSLAEGLKQDLSPTVHFLIRLRVFHPAIAIGVGLYAIVAVWLSGAQQSRAMKRSAQILAALFVAQLAIGAINVALLAPIAIQLVHLLMADAVWIVLVIASALALGQPSEAQEHLVVGERVVAQR
jgi:heme A synthase